MSDKFTCPQCGTPQPIKQLLVMSNISVWKCPECETRIKPGKMSPFAVFWGFLSVFIPAIIAKRMFYASFSTAITLGLLGGIIAYLLTVLYYYKTIKLEIAE